MSAQKVEFDILMIGFNQQLFDLISPMLGTLSPKRAATAAEVDSILNEYQLSPGTTVFVSSDLSGMSHLEVAQAVSSYFQGVHIVFVTLDQAKFGVADLKKNGFTACYIWPLDRKLIQDFLDDIKAKGGKGFTRKFKAVKLVDIHPGMELPFEVRTYLPLNDKYVLLTGSGSLSQRKFERLQNKNINSVFLDTQQIERFYKFAADQLIGLADAKSETDPVSQTEKSERFQTAVRGLITSILDSTPGSGDLEIGRDLADQSKKIVESYVAQKTGLNLKDKLLALAGEDGDFYSHAQVVSTTACLLSMGTGIGNPEDLAIAGLFHDLGMSGIEDIVSPFDTDSLSAEDKKKYDAHPRQSLNLLKEKRISVTPLIAEIIEKHHERVDGKGIPSGLAAHRIPPEAHLLAYADAFAFLSRTIPGQQRASPEEIHRRIADELGLSPSVISKVGSFLSAIS